MAIQGDALGQIKACGSRLSTVLLEPGTTVPGDGGYLACRGTIQNGFASNAHNKDAYDKAPEYQSCPDWRLRCSCIET
jgi:ferredoxin